MNIALALLGLLAQESIEQVRTRTAYTLDQGEVEIELVGSYLRISEKDVSTFKGAVEVEYGITDNFMAEIEIVYLALDVDRGKNERGWGDFEIESKYRLPWTLEEVEFAVGAEVSLLTGDEDEGLGDQDTEFGIFGAASRVVGPLLLHLEGGTEVQEEKKPEYEINTAVDWRPWGDDVSLLLAFNGELEPDDKPAWTIVPGFEVRLEMDEGGEEEWEIEVGAGFPLGLSEEAEDWGVIVNVEIEF